MKAKTLMKAAEKNDMSTVKDLLATARHAKNTTDLLKMELLAPLSAHNRIKNSKAFDTLLKWARP